LAQWGPACKSLRKSGRYQRFGQSEQCSAAPGRLKPKLILRSVERRTVLFVSSAPSGGLLRHQKDLISLVDSDRYAIEVACPLGCDLWKWLDTRTDVYRHPIVMPREPAPVDAATLVQLTRLVSRAHVVHAHAAKAGLLSRLAARLVGRSSSCIFTPHGWSFWAFDGVRRNAYLSIERHAARWCRTIIAVSRFERDVGRAAGIGPPERYRVIANGIDIERFALAPEPVPGRVIMVARFVSQKDHVAAVRAMALLRRTQPGATLQLVGEGPLRGDVEQLVDSLGLHDRVSFLGEREDVPELLAQASCCLLSTHYEGCSLAVLEAMAAGLPVVATRVGGMAEIVSEGATGLLVDPAPAAIAHALDALIADPTLARRMGGTGRGEARRRLSRERMAAEVQQVYDETCASSA